MLELKNFQVSTDDQGVLIATLDVPDRPVNVFDDTVLKELHEVVQHVASSTEVKAVVFRSGKESGFLAGADIHRLQQISSEDEANWILEQGQELFNAVERLQVPTVAVIHGACMGGGLEFAMSCNDRVAVDHPTTKLGLPEVKLGLIPAWGGTQRLPRHVGLSEALPMMLQGKAVSARDAYELGLVQHLITSFEAHDEIEAFIHQRMKQLPLRGPVRSWKKWALDGNWLGRKIVIATARKQSARHAKHYPALNWIIDATAKGMNSPAVSPEGLRKEREGFSKLIMGPVARNLVGIFLNQERARKSTTWSSVESPLTVKKIAVIGAGTMGAGIAQAAALRGFHVILQDIQEEFVERGMNTIRELTGKAVKKGAVSQEDAEAALGRLTPRVDWGESSDVDLLIEAVVERMDIKQSIFSKADELLPEQAILASNTSALPIDEMISATRRADRVAGLHFFNPVHKMPLVEVVRTPRSSDETVATLVGVSKKLGKVPVVVRQSPGFLVNRILFPYLDEAVRLVVEGHSIEEVDKAAKKFGMPMGPLELLDVVGIDVGQHVSQTLVPTDKDASPTPDALQKMVDAGHTGQKSWTGFYVWEKGKRMKPADLPFAVSETVTDLIDDWTVNGEKLSPIQQRLALAMCNEAQKCLNEQVVEEPWMVDLGMVLGTGFAPFRGGPMKCIETWGAGAVHDRLNLLAEKLGPRYTPAPSESASSESAST